MLRLIALLLGGCGPEAAAPPADPSRPPNVLLITVCSVRRDHLGFYGYPVVTSPALDALAARSVVFENAFANASFTDASHASLFTGLYPGHSGVLDFGENIRPDAHTLPEILSLYGYRSKAYISSTDHFPISAAETIGRGFGAPAFGVPLDTELPAWIGTDPQPWLAWVHLRQAHRPYGSGAPFTDQVLPEVKNWLAGVLPPAGPNGLTDPSLSPDTRFLQALQRPEVSQNLQAVYDAGIRSMDDALGSLLATLEKQHQLDHTIVIVAGDHGENLGESGMFGHQGYLTENVVRVPLLIRLPGGTARRESTMVSLVDLLPTITELVGATVPAGLDGASLGPALTGAPLAARPVLAQAVALQPDHQHVDLYEMVRDGNYWLSVQPPAPILWKQEGANWLNMTTIDAEQLSRMETIRKRLSEGSIWSAKRPELPANVQQELRKNGYW